MIGGAKGIGIGIDFGIPNQYCRATSKPYIEKDVLDSLRVVASAYGKSNDDADRSIVKNLVDASNPFIISNAAFKLNSGFGKYEQDFTDWRKSSKVTSFDSESIKFTSDVPWILLYYSSSIGEDIPSFKVRIKLYGEGTLYYNYITQEGKYTNVAVKSEIFETPICYNTKYTGEKGVNVGFTLGVSSGECSGTITQIPSFEGAFVTDGVDDLITSTKTVQEMGITDEVTVVSMIHQIDKPSNFITTNNIRAFGSVVGRNAISLTDKTGIYGWYKDNIQGSTINVINNILGDKADYTASASSNTNLSSKFSVVGYISNDSIIETSQVAWYWTIIANKVLTTDQINQVIAYFNLDRTLNPDILCNTIKQGITNENHAEFGDKLIDFSGNGRDIQLNNLAWKGNSGIGKYNFSNINIIPSNRFEGAVTTNKCHFTKKLTNATNNFCDLLVISPNEPIKFKVSGLSDGRKLFVANKSGSGSNYNFDNGEHEVSLSFSEGVGQNNPFGVTGDIGDIDVIVEFIPSHAGALCLDGVSDFGKVTGMPIYKDYTVIADYERFYLEPITGGRASILSKSSKVGDGSFIFNLEYQDGGKACYTFGEANGNVSDDITRIIRYQSKYYNTKTLSIGTAKDNDFMVLGKVREVDSRHFCGAIYSLMSFPYSMSEFLIERQLKKHKLGTLYPDMVEFRPIVKSNLPYSSITYSVNPGEYISVDSMVTITVTLPNTSDKLMEVSCNAISDISISGDNGVYEITGKIVKSPQKINLVISSYLTMLNNETLISNETLIKNE
jgi:hypothetical protein|nr:MAG TPA: hypothetical protein [Caudoviricetes sp.]